MKIPYLDATSTQQTLDVDINSVQFEMLQAMGFKIKNDWLDWDYSYMMSDSNSVFFEGRRQRDILMNILNINL